MGTRRERQKRDGRSSSYINSAAPSPTIGRGSGKESDEVVKYMSKLPCYLQGDESNVLNVGVLDWSRLEKWKHGRSRASESKVSSTTTTTLGTLPNASHHRCSKFDDDDQVPACSNLGKVVKASRDIQHGTLECELDSSLNKEEMPSCSSARRDQERVKIPGRSHSSSLGSKGNLVVRDEMRAGAQEARGSGKLCVDKLDGEEKTVGAALTFEKHQKLSNIVLLPSTKHSPSTTLSCPLSFDLERDSEDMMLPLLAKKEPSGGTRSHSKTASRIFDQQKKRDPSPSKRLSFSFGRLSRSFTLKEDSSDTIKSDSMRFDGLACPSQSSNPEEKHNTLRRLLHPLLKSKASENVLPSKSTSGSSNPKPANMDLPLQDEMKKQDASRTRALFQLTVRNGIPLFQFVVDDRNILGATMQSSASSFKDDSVQYCTFYSVNEVKKKRLIHGHKEKQQHRFVYNVIGQMQLCNSSMNDQNISSVLVDASEQVTGRKEIAAVVIKKKPAQENFTTVIIPGGVHSIPEKGAPTPLISRWRSGGCCDCGGWDVGCKLHVLSNKTFLHDLNLDQGFKLFHQEESDKNSGPVLAMTELKTGIYRVEFGSFLSHLQAFFVCVTVVTCASEEETVSKTTGRSSSPFAPPLSPVGRA